MNIIKAIHDKKLFRQYVTGSSNGDLASWQNWLAFLHVLYGLPITAEQLDITRTCTGRDPAKLSADGYLECLLMCGRRSGKSKTIALVGAFEAVLSGKEKQLSTGEIPLVAILSPTRNQSRIIFTYLKGVFDSTPLLKNEVAEQEKFSFKLKNGVEISIVTGSPTSSRGFSVIAAIVDEIAMFGLSEESKVRSDTELVRALRPSLGTTGGRLLCVGTPYAAMGYAYQTWKKNFGNDEANTLVWNAPSTTMNPTLSQKVVDNALAEDAIAAAVEYCIRPGLFREDVDQFISREVVENLVVHGRTELPPISGIPYSAFVDMSGGRSDDAALCIGHRNDRVVVIDYLKKYKSPHNPYEVVAGMVNEVRRYNITEVCGDAYSAEWSRIAFESHGIKYDRSSRTQYKEGSAEQRVKVAKPRSVLYLELLPRLTAGEIELPDNDQLITQLSLLQRRVRSGARDSIDHPPGGHDDLANVVAGCSMLCFERKKLLLGSMTDRPTVTTINTNDVGSVALQHFDIDQHLYQQEREELGRRESPREVAKQHLHKIFPRSPRFF